MLGVELQQRRAALEQRGLAADHAAHTDLGRARASAASRARVIVAATGPCVCAPGASISGPAGIGRVRSSMPRQRADAAHERDEHFARGCDLGLREPGRADEQSVRADPPLMGERPWGGVDPAGVVDGLGRARARCRTWSRPSNVSTVGAGGEAQPQAMIGRTVVERDLAPHERHAGRDTRLDVERADLVELARRRAGARCLTRAACARR